MRYIQIFILSLIFAAQISVSQTKTGKGFIASFGGGLSFPMNEPNFKDNYDYGLNICFMGGYKLNNLYLVRGGIHYNRFTYSEIGNGTGSFKAVVMNAEILIGAFSTKHKYHPYGIFGTGIYFLSSKLTLNGINYSPTENDIGLSAGGGIILDLSKNIGVFAEAQYNYMFNDGSVKGFLPFIVGLSFAP